MKAVIVTTGVPGSARLGRVPEPKLTPGEVVVKVLRVGLCGTDREISDGLYGEAPEGCEYLIIGHESLGKVVEVTDVSAGLSPGELVVATVRRPDGCPNCRRGQIDMCLTGGYKERGIKGLHGFLAEWFSEKPGFLVKVPESLGALGVLLEPMSVVEKAVSQAYTIQTRMHWEPRTALVLGVGPIGLLGVMLLRELGLTVYAYARSAPGGVKTEIVEAVGGTYLSGQEVPVERLGDRIGANIDFVLEATGNSSAAFSAMAVLGINGVLCLTGVTGGNKALEVPADCINLRMVLGNRVVFGSVNASREDFQRGVGHLEQFREHWPGVLDRLITRSMAMEEYGHALAYHKEDIKTVIEVA